MNHPREITDTIGVADSDSPPMPGRLEERRDHIGFILVVLILATLANLVILTVVALAVGDIRNELDNDQRIVVDNAPAPTEEGLGA